jgi:hypothetical protein
MANSNVSDWDEIEADPEFSSFPRETQLGLFNDWEKKFNRTLLEDADLDKVKPEGLNRFAATNAIRRRKLAGEDVSDPNTAVKSWSEQKQAEAKLAQQTLKDYAEVEDKKFRLDDARSMPGVDEFGRASPEWDRGVQDASKSLEAAEAKFTPEVRAQAQAASEALKGKHKIATMQGNIYTDPALVLNKEEFRQQVLDSDASPEAKALKLASFQSEKKRYLDEAANTLTKGDPQIPLAESFPKFLESKGFNLDREMVQQSEGKLDYSPIQKQRELTQEYLTKMQDRGWFRKIGSAIATGVATGMLDIGTQAVGTAAMLTGKAGNRVFPTQHPFVKNPDGSASNVMMAGVGLEGREYVIPTMVDGKQLSIEEAVKVARKIGLNKYPSFSTAKEADDFAQKNHGSIDESGYLRDPSGENLSKIAAELSRASGDIGAAQELEGDMQATGGTFAGGISRLGTNMAPMLLPGGAVGGMARMAGAGAGAATAAAVGASALTAGAQTAGSQFGEVYDHLRQQGSTHEQAFNVSRNAAVLSGAVTTALTALGGATGVESLLRQGGKDLVKSRFVAAMKAVPGGAAAEIAEELPDEYVSQLVSAFAKDPTASVSQITDEFAANAPDLILQIAALGGAGSGVSRFKETTTDPTKAGQPTPADDFAQRAAMEGATEYRAPEEAAARADMRAAAEEEIKKGIPVEVEGVVIATIPPESDYTPEDVLDFANSPEDMATLARNGKITLPEVVAPIEGVDSAITDEMNVRVAASAALAPQTTAFTAANQGEAAPAPEVQAETAEPIATREPGAAETPVVEPVEEVKPTETLGVTPPPAPTLEASEGAARNADIIRQAAARMAGTESGPRIGFLQPSPAVTTATETPIDAANVDGGSQGVQTEPAEGSIPAVTDDIVSTSDTPSTPVSPQGEAPTTATEGKVMPGGSSTSQFFEFDGTNEIRRQHPDYVERTGTITDVKTQMVPDPSGKPVPITFVAIQTPDGGKISVKLQGRVPASIVGKTATVGGRDLENHGNGVFAFMNLEGAQKFILSQQASQSEWSPTPGQPASANINGQKVVGTVGPSTGKGLVSFQYEWNGKTQKATVRPDRLSSPVASLVDPPSYQYTQEQNTRKMAKHFPSALGVHANHDFRKSFASMAKDTSLSRIYRQMARELAKMSAFANMDLHVVADENQAYAGEYSFDNGKASIGVNLRQVGRGRVDALGTLLHEALHHVTLAKVRDPQGTWENEVLDKLDTIRGKVLEFAKSQGLDQRLDYELGTVEEFITAVFTRPDFQNFLASIPDSFSTGVAVGKFRSVLSEVFRLITEFLSGEPVARGSTMEQSMTTILAMFETPFRAVETGKLEALNAVQSGVQQATPESIRHAELEAKFNAGAITPEETAEAQALVDERAKAAGYAIEAWHGSGSGPFSTFRLSEVGGIFVALDKKEAANFAVGRDASLRRFYVRGKYPERVHLSVDERVAANQAKRAGRDGIRVSDSDGWDRFTNKPVERSVNLLVFDRNNIKSADPFTGVPLDQRFDEKSNDIRASRAEGRGYRTPADMLAEAAQKARGEAVGTKPQGLASMFNPQAKRPATGERKLLDMPKKPEPVRLDVRRTKKTIETKSGPVTVGKLSDDLTDTNAANGKDAGSVLGTVDIADLAGMLRLNQPEERRRVDALKAKILSEEGLISPIIVSANGEVIEGQHRLAAMRELGATEMPVAVSYEASDFIPDVDALKKSLSGFSLHRQQVDQLIGNLAEMLMDEKGDANELSSYDMPKPFDAVFKVAVAEVQRQLGVAATTKPVTLANAYREAVRGSSTQMAPLSTVYAQARLLQPGLTEVDFLKMVQEGYDSNTLLLEGAGTQQEAEQSSLSLPGTPVGTAVRMMPAPQGTLKSLAEDQEAYEADVPTGENAIRVVDNKYDKLRFVRSIGTMDETAKQRIRNTLLSDEGLTRELGDAVGLPKWQSDPVKKLVDMLFKSAERYAENTDASANQEPNLWAQSRIGGGTLKSKADDMDAEYMAAVESGDVAKQRAMVNAAAKAAVQPFSTETRRTGFTNHTKVRLGSREVSVFRDPENGYWYFADKGGLGDVIAMGKQAAIKAAIERLEEESGGAQPSTEVLFRDWRNDTTITLPGFYLRFGDLPKGGKSVKGHEPGLYEKGVSVLKAWRSPDGVYVISSVGAETGASDMVAGMEGRPIYIAYGEDTGEVGSDGEPLLKNVVLTELVMNNRVVVDDASYIDQPITNNISETKEWETISPAPDPLAAADPVTRDDQGNVIPLSQRFNPKSNSTLYSKADDGEPPIIDIGGETEPADGKGKQLYQKNPTAIGDTYISPADITLQEKKTQQETLDAARKIIGEEIAKAPNNTLAGRRAALNRFRLDTSIPPEVRAVGTGVIAQQADRMANLSEGNNQLLLDEMADEAAKLSGIMSSDLEAWRNLKADANLQIDKMAEEAGRTLNIFNVFRRLTPEGFLRRMTRQFNDAVREKVGQNFDVPAGEVEAEIMRLWKMMQEAGATARGESIAAALKAFMPRRVNTRKIIGSLFPQAGIRDRMSKGGEALVRDFFQMMAGPRDGKGPLAEFDETIQGALSSMLRKVMEAQGLVAKNKSVQMTDIDKMVRAISADELRFDKIAAADEAMQKELDGIEDLERRAVLQQAWEEATAKMYTNIASDATVRRAINAELKSENVDWAKMFDSNQKPTAIKAKTVDAVMAKIEALLTDPSDPTVRANLGMLRGEVEAAFDFIAANKRTEWLAQREAIEARRRVAEHRAAFMEALRNQGVAEQAINRISEKLAGPQRGKPDQNPVSALVGEHMKAPVADFVDKLVALDVDRATAESLDKAASTLRAEVAAADKLKAAERAVAQLMKSLKPKPRAPREKIEKALKTLFTADTVGALDDQAFFDAFGEAFGMPPLSDEQQTRIKKLIREVNALPKGPARLDKQQDLDEELALWKGIAARDVLLSAWYANILSGVSTQGMGLSGNALNFVPRSLFNIINNPRSAGAYFKGAFGEGLSTGLKEAMAAMKGRGLYKVSKYGDKSLVSALELLRKKGPSTLPEWVAYIASAGTRLRYVFRIMQAIDALAWNTAREGHAYLAAHRALLEQEKESGTKRSPEEFSRAFIDSLGGDVAQIEEDLRAARQSLIDAGQTPSLLAVDRMAREARNLRRAASGVKAGNRFADRIVLQQDPEGSGKFISNLIEVFQKKDILGLPIGQLLIPFNRIVSNLFEQSLDYTPVGLVRAFLGGHLSDVKPGSFWNGKVEFKDKSQLFDQMERRERAMAAVTGMAAAAAIYALASAHEDEPDEDVPFMVYGWGSESKNKRAQMPKGWVPYSIKIGDNYIKFSEMPFGMMFAAAGSAMDAMRYKNMDKKTSTQRLAYVLKTAAKGFLNQGVMSSLDTAMETLMFDASEKKMADIPVNALKGLVPAQGMLRDISTIMDPNKVSSDSLTSALLRDIPFAKSWGTKPDLNVFGEPIKLDGYPITRRIITHREPHAVADYLGRNELSIPGMEQTIEIGKYLPDKAKDRIQARAVELGAMENGLFTPEQNYAFKKRAGELTKAAVQAIMQEAPKIETEKQRESVQSAINKRVEVARRRAMLEAVPVK